MKNPRRFRKLAFHSRVVKVRWLHNWLRLVMRITKCFHYGMVAQAFKELLLFYGVNYKVQKQLLNIVYGFKRATRLDKTITKCTNT
jgi:hypothetical protein